MRHNIITVYSVIYENETGETFIVQKWKTILYLVIREATCFKFSNAISSWTKIVPSGLYVLPV
jgi:hypothetical protein